MNVNLLKFVELITEFEGGYVNHPDDPGGATNKGITLETLMSYRNIKDPVVALENLRNLTIDQAAEIYKEGYWRQVNASILPPGVDIFVADWAVHSGPKTAIRQLQRVLGVVDDGSLGPVTREALKEDSPSALLHDLYIARHTFFHEISYGKPTRVFLKGWLNRIHKLYLETMEMAYGT